MVSCDLAEELLPQEASVELGDEERLVVYGEAGGD